MNVLAVCGAANKKRNTASMLRSAFEGAMSVPGAAGEFLWLFDLAFRGCRGCHACKLTGGASYARCAQRDGLTPVLDKAVGADVVLIGSPIYFGGVTGETRSFLERWLFPGMTYGKVRELTYPKRSNVGWVFTMGAPEGSYSGYFEELTASTSRLGGVSEYVAASRTQQFDDYARYGATMFDEEMIRARHLEQFPKDCAAAFEMGKRLAGQP